MRKIFLLITMACFLVSCVEDLYPGVLGPEKVLGLNADLRTTDSLHTVLLYYSKQTSTEAVEDASVSIFVNGELADMTSKAKMLKQDYAQYELKAVLSEGDRVNIVAEKAGNRVEAEAEVLPRPTIVEVKHGFKREKDPLTELSSAFVDLGVGMEDYSSEISYYAIEVLLEKHCIRDDDGQAMEDYYDRIHLDISKEPLLTANFPSMFEIMSSSQYDLYSDFKYWAFTDTPFRGGSYSLSLRAPFTSEFYPHHVMVSTYGIAEQYTMTRTLEVRLSAVPRSVYTTYTSAYFDRSELSSLLIFNSDYGYPSNVRGGTGLVNVWSGAVERIDLGVCHYDMDTGDFDP